MNTQRIKSLPLEVTRIGYGCMNLGGSWSHDSLTEQDRNNAIGIINAALEEGINCFDHADIYTYGKSEAVFSELWRESPHLRGQIVVQSKCGVRWAGESSDRIPLRYDFSYEHIMASVEGSLHRLKTDYLDILLLHRPDALVEPQEVARAFDSLQQSGKVRHFGVSNHTGAQIELLQRWVDQPLVVNQLQLNMLHTHLIDGGLVLNENNPARLVRGGDTLEYCQLHDITIQAWAPMAGGVLSGKALEITDERIKKVSALVAALAEEKSVSREAIVVAWVLRHPAQIQPIIGTTKPERIKAACQAGRVDLTREEWYSLFVAGRGAALP
jgi:predicted oxidoreductase